MDHLQLSPSEVTAVRRLLTVDEADYEIRVLAMLEALHPLIPSDTLGAGVGNRFGLMEFEVDLPRQPYDLGPQVCDGPLQTGLVHLLGSVEGREELDVWAPLGIRDCLRLGVPLGSGRVAQIYLDRYTGYFDVRDVELLSMLEPALTRLLRPPERPAPMRALSGAEQKVLALVSHGATNREAAECLSVSEATVRKHLEHTYRKLGVTNRTAAAALLRASATREVSRIR